MSRPQSSRFRVFFGAVILVTIVPLFSVSPLPFTDLPEHVAVMSALRHWFDPAFALRETFVFEPLRSQYLLYHLAGGVLTYATGSAEIANLLLVTAAVVGTPLALARFLRVLHGDPRLAVFACALTYNRALVVGFLPFVASIPLVLVALSEAVLFARRASRGRGARLAILAVVLFYTHVSAYLTFMLIGAPLLVLFARTKGRASLRTLVRTAMPGVVWLLPSVVAALVWLAVGRLAIQSQTLAGAGEIGKISLTRALHGLPLWCFDVWKSHGDEVAGGVFWTALTVLVVGAARAGVPKRPLRLHLARWLPVTVLALTFLLTPFRVGSGTMLNVRLSSLLVLVALAPLPRVGGWLGRTAFAGAAVSTAIASAVAIVEMRRTVAEELGGALDLVDRLPLAARLVVLNFDADSRVARFPPWLHVGAYHRSRHGGLHAFSFSELGHWPIQYRSGKAPPKKGQTFWEFDPCVYRNAVDGAFYDSVLVRGNVNPFVDAPPGPVFEEVAHTSRYRLFRRAEGTWPAWPVNDKGPCYRRFELEVDAAEAEKQKKVDEAPVEP